MTPAGPPLPVRSSLQAFGFFARPKQPKLARPNSLKSCRPVDPVLDRIGSNYDTFEQSVGFANISPFSLHRECLTKATI